MLRKRALLYREKLVENEILKKIQLRYNIKSNLIKKKTEKNRKNEKESPRIVRDRIGAVLFLQTRMIPSTISNSDADCDYAANSQGFSSRNASSIVVLFICAVAIFS